VDDGDPADRPLQHLAQRLGDRRQRIPLEDVAAQLDDDRRLGV
jgi:hypothetical protein